MLFCETFDEFVQFRHRIELKVLDKNVPTLLISVHVLCRTSQLYLVKVKRLEAERPLVPPLKLLLMPETPPDPILTSPLRLSPSLDSNQRHEPMSNLVSEATNPVDAPISAQVDASD